MSTSVKSARGSDFAVLSRQIRTAGLLERRRGNYALRIALTAIAFVGSWFLFWWLGDSWRQLATAAALGLVYTQVAFLGHDGGHQQVARSRRVNDVLGIVSGNLLVGLSFGWWVDEHNQHHAHPNYEGRDPDIGDGVLIFTTEQAAARAGVIARFIGRHQAWLFFPLLTLEGLNLRVQAFGWLRRATSRRRRRIELILLSVHTVAYFGAVFLVLSPIKAIAFICIHQAVWGVYMGCSFAPNHKGMPTIPPGGELDFLRRQVLTARNVRGGPFTDFVFGGLNYQIEHHLFPNMPRCNLHRAQPIVRAYCLQMQIPYTSTSLFGSYAVVLRHLHALGEPLRRVG